MEQVLEKIYNSSLKLLLPLTPKETYAIIVQEATKLVKAEYGSIFLAKGKTLYRVYSSVTTSSQIEPRKNGYTYRTFREGKVFVMPLQTILKTHPEFNNAKIKSFILIPLSYRKESLGVLTLQSKKSEHFTKNKIHILKLFGSMASLAIKKTQLYSTAQQALDTRDLFISMAAHELKTPLMVINGYSQIIKKNLMRGEIPEYRWAETLTSEISRLIHLVDELLQIDQVKTGEFQYHFTKSSLREIANRAIMNFKITYPEYILKLEDRLGKRKDTVNGDADKLLQVIINLLNNAAKFSSPSSPITLSLGYRNNNSLTLVVADRGKGISKEDLPHIFQGFYKGGAHRREGMGLGLFLTKDIIDQHKGSITVNSRLNHGTTVTITIPLYED